jgi:hypothetical protein
LGDKGVISRRSFLKLIPFLASVGFAAALPDLSEMLAHEDIFIPSLGEDGGFIHFSKGNVFDKENKLLGSFEEFSNLPYLANKRIANPSLPNKQFVDVTPDSLRSEPWKKYMSVINETAVGNMRPDFTDVLYTTSNYLKWSEKWFQKELLYKGSREIDDLIGAGNTICFEFAIAVHCAMACLGQTTELFIITNKPHAIVVYNNGVQGDMVGDACFPDSGAVPLESYKKLMSEKLDVSYLSLEKIEPAFKPLSTLKSQ